MKKFLSLLVVCCGLVACAPSNVNHKTSEDVAAKVPAKQEPLYSKAVFDLSGWSVATNLEGKPLDNEKATRILIASKDYESYRVILTAAVLPTKESSVEFSENMVRAVNSRSGVQLLDYANVSVGKTDAILAYETRETSSGSVVFICDLFFSDGSLGYAVSCGGPAEHLKQWNPDCARALSTLKLKE